MADRPDDPADAHGDPHQDLRGALHDVSNALTVLLGWIAEARAEGQTTEGLALALGVAEAQALLAKNMARRAIGDARAVDEEPPDGWVQLAHDVVQRVRLALSVEASRRGVRIEVGTHDVVMIEHAEDLAQVLTNLVLNALDHAPPGSAVRVSVRGGAGAEIDVVDEGPGVARDREKSIFGGDSSRDGGTGTGLPYSRDIARARGGDVTLVRGKGGAAFRVSWPSAPTPRPPPTSLHSLRQASVPRAHVLASTRVLVLDDDDAINDMLSTSLAARGADVVVIRARSELPEALAGPPFDVALVDLSPLAGDVEGGIRRMDGVVGKVVLITGSADKVPEGLLGPGGSSLDVIRKPFEVSEIIAIVAGSRAPGG